MLGYYAALCGRQGAEMAVRRIMYVFVFLRIIALDGLSMEKLSCVRV